MMNLEKLTQEYYINSLIKRGIEYNEVMSIIKSFTKKNVYQINACFDRYKNNPDVNEILYALNILGQDLVHGSHLYTFIKDSELFTLEYK